MCRSPTDNLLVAMGRWMDETIPLVPNRYRSALQATAAGETRAPVERHLLATSMSMEPVQPHERGNLSR